MEYAGLIFDDSKHFLDHLGPFCATLNWPLIVCEPELYEIAQRDYPDLDVRLSSAFDCKLAKNTVSCHTSFHLKAAFPHQKTQNLWLPHGNSDKGIHSPFFEALNHEKICLVYGQKMVDLLKKQGVSSKTVRIGNFRYQYFQKHAAFYKRRVKLPKGNNILYAPTWDDYENNCSFWSCFTPLVQQIPKNWNLILKLHPNTLKKKLPEIEVLRGQFGKMPNLIFLDDLPPIYPILSQVSALIADTSSIGYDFLTFDKPFFFLNADQKLPLHNCGISIDASQFSFSIQDSFSEQRRWLYKYTFDENLDFKAIQDQIHALCRN